MNHSTINDLDQNGLCSSFIYHMYINNNIIFWNHSSAKKNCNFKRKSSILWSKSICPKISLPMEGFKKNPYSILARCVTDGWISDMFCVKGINFEQVFLKQIWISSKKKSFPSFVAWFSIFIKLAFIFKRNTQGIGVRYRSSLKFDPSL